MLQVRSYNESKWCCEWLHMYYNGLEHLSWWGHTHQKGQGWSTVGLKFTWVTTMLHGWSPTWPDICLAKLGKTAAGELAVLSWNKMSPASNARPSPSDVSMYLWTMKYVSKICTPRVVPYPPPQVKVESEGTLWGCLSLTLTKSWSPHNGAHLSHTCNIDVA